MNLCKKARRAAALLLTAALLLASCGQKTAATAMHLRKTEGTVGVSDSQGKDVAPRENLGLYSGYGVDTWAESYAWIDLDDIKLTKLDQNSEIEIKKEDKHLTVEVKSGSLFFNVTEPLADDEALDIRCSTMMVGIRGTCGWVTEEAVYLLDGTVTVTAGEERASVNAGEMATVTAEGTIDVKPFSPQDIPAFVMDELTRLPEGEDPGDYQEDYDPADLDPANAVSNIRFEHIDNGLFFLKWDAPANEESIRPTDSSSYLGYRIYLKEGDSWVTGGDAWDEEWGIAGIYRSTTYTNDTNILIPTNKAGSYTGVKIETVIQNNTSYRDTVLGVCEDTSIRLTVTKAPPGSAVSVTFEEAEVVGTDDGVTISLSNLMPDTYHCMIFRGGKSSYFGFGGYGKSDGTFSHTTGGNSMRENIKSSEYLVVEYPNIVVSGDGKTASYTILQRGDWTKCVF